MSHLGSFRGSFAGLGIGERLMPIIHVYAYHASWVPEIARKDFLCQVREELRFPMEERDLRVECITKGDNQMSLHRVSFRLPRRAATRALRKMRWQREDVRLVEGGRDEWKPSDSERKGEDMGDRKSD